MQRLLLTGQALTTRSPVAPHSPSHPRVIHPSTASTLSTTFASTLPTAIIIPSRPSPIHTAPTTNRHLPSRHVIHPVNHVVKSVTLLRIRLPYSNCQSLCRPPLHPSSELPSVLPFQFPPQHRANHQGFRLPNWLHLLVNGSKLWRCGVARLRSA
jgi:hypothetical protein